jgi:membrane-bound serine protease (ClpP class)
LIEIFTTGWGVAGSLGIISLALYYSSHVFAGYVHWGVIILFLVGLILLALEIFAVPGFGFTGISGIAAILVSVLWSAPTVELALIYILIAMVGTAVLLAVSFKFLTKRRLWNKIILGEKQEKELGYLAAVGRKDLIGRKGSVLSDLRPAGAIVVDGERIDAISEGGYIQKGDEIVIIKVEGSKVVVKRK